MYNQLLAAFFEWGVAFYDLEFDLMKDGTKSKAAFKADALRLWRKARRQLAKDFVLSRRCRPPGPPGRRRGLVANTVRNFWAPP